MPLVSIIIPCHNAAQWLAETLESALAQTWPEKEILLVDDGSTDDSLAIARTFEPRGIRLFCQSNRGASAARNAGLREAKGDFIQFLDADDLIDADKIACQVDRLGREPAHAIASGAWARFYRHPDEAEFCPEPPWQDWNDPVAFLRLLYREFWMMHPASWLLPRELAFRAGPWNESLSLNDDGEYFCRVILGAVKIAFCPDARVRYRSALPGSLSRRLDPSACRSLFCSHTLCARHLLARDQSPDSKQALANAFQRLVYELYPAARPLSEAAQRRAAELGGSNVKPMMGPKTRVLARLIGWRAVFWFKFCWRNRRLPPPAHVYAV